MRELRRDIAWPLTAFVALWTLVGTIAMLSRPLHQDMLEAWAWGQELQLGYSKHPPLSAWVAGFWFAVVPRAGWTFYLLPMVNAAVGLAGIWMIARRLLPDPYSRSAAVWLHGLAPFHSLFALNFNANSIQLSVWPWVMYALIRTLESRRLHHAVGLGVLAGLAILAKYYAVILLACCFVAAIAHPQARVFFRSGAPYVAAAVAAAVVAPHALWALDHGLPTIAYALDKTQQSYPVMVKEAAIAGAVCVLLLCGVAAALWHIGFAGQPWSVAALSRALLEPQRRWLSILAFGPFLLTVAVGLAGLAKVSIVFMTPAFALVPLVLLQSAGQAPGADGLRLIRRWTIGVQVACLGLAPLFAIYFFTSDMRNEAQRNVELAGVVERLWAAETVVPLAIVGGFGRDAEIVAFYGASRPSVFVNLDFKQAPWVTRERIVREGLVVVCGSNFRALCQARMNDLWLAARRLELQTGQRVLGFNGVDRAFDVYLVVPPPGILRGG